VGGQRSTDSGGRHDRRVRQSVRKKTLEGGHVVPLRGGGPFHFISKKATFIWRDTIFLLAAE
jgi:hypothetical protein